MNLQSMFKQAKEMQEKLAAVQDELGKMQISAHVENGKITITVNGSGKVIGVDIKPSIIDPNDPEKLNDLVLLAIQKAQDQAAETANAKVTAASSGLNLPGMPNF